MKQLLAFLALAAIPAIAGAATTRAQALMGTVCEITVPDSDAALIDELFAEGKRVEGLISTWRDDTELARLNSGATQTISAELRGALGTTLDWAKRTEGAFNPLVRPLIDVWKTRDGGAVPSREALAEAKTKVALTNAEPAGPNGMILHNGAKFEEGAWGKGLALDRMLGILSRHGTLRATINFGGQIAQLGDQPFVVIADPAKRDAPAVGVTLVKRSLSTSSGSEKVFTVGDRTFTHIIDPRTGEALPPRGSVSVMHDSAFIADILSTALYVMGPYAGRDWARAHNIAAIFITEKNEVLTSVPMPSLKVLDAKFTVKN